MENQFCKVGTVTAIGNDPQSLSILQLRYESFLEKAAQFAGIDSKLTEFLESKANGIKKLLEEL
ncbi:hypothetical protein BUL40_12785 [Croceivirga radicis]|uniref:Uncharacterized protein n=1 Tax=Croceivirga radicis TaxID=1929488 RepID=A0A1V6LP51_9FLAO|nr:hypothetical protein [Croceivirga radicis]OQD41985.1 hypothetical protein BUL40_12785 [Croceivirga radicis]